MVTIYCDAWHIDAWEQWICLLVHYMQLAVLRTSELNQCTLKDRI